MAESLEEKVKSGNSPVKEKTRAFDVAHLLGTLGSYAGGAIGAYLTNSYTKSPYLSAAVGSTVGDYLGYEAGFTPYWYLKNTERYKGLSGKVKFAKDWTSFSVKALALDAGAYLVNVPLAIGATYLTGSPVLGTVLSGLAVDIGYWLGLRGLNKKKLAEVAEDSSKAAYAH